MSLEPFLTNPKKKGGKRGRKAGKKRGRSMMLIPLRRPNKKGGKKRHKNPGVPGMELALMNPRAHKRGRRHHNPMILGVPVSLPLVGGAVVGSVADRQLINRGIQKLPDMLKRLKAGIPNKLTRLAVGFGGAWGLSRAKHQGIKSFGAGLGIGVAASVVAEGVGEILVKMGVSETVGAEGVDAFDPGLSGADEIGVGADGEPLQLAGPEGTDAYGVEAFDPGISAFDPSGVGAGAEDLTAIEIPD